MKTSAVRIGGRPDARPAMWHIDNGHTTPQSGVIVGDTKSGKSTVLGHVYEAVASDPGRTAAIMSIANPTEWGDILDWAATEAERRTALASLGPLHLFVDDAHEILGATNHDLWQRLARAATQRRCGITLALQGVTQEHFHRLAGLREAVTSQILALRVRGTTHAVERLLGARLGEAGPGTGVLRTPHVGAEVVTLDAATPHPLVAA